MLLYDLTSTYVEGAAPRNPMLARGYSRDHRGDCLQLVLALIVNVEGFPLSDETFDGDRTDVTTLETIMRMVERKYGRARRVWREAREGAYLLRTNLEGQRAEEIWTTYIQLTEAEAAFRALKSELAIRPVFHQLERRVKAHVLVASGLDQLETTIPTHLEWNAECSGDFVAS